MTYSVRLRTIDGREVVMCVLDGKVVESNTYRVVTNLRSGIWWVDMSDDWLKENPYRPLRKELDDATVVPEIRGAI